MPTKDKSNTHILTKEVGNPNLILDDKNTITATKNKKARDAARLNEVVMRDYEASKKGFDEVRIFHQEIGRYCMPTKNNFSDLRGANVEGLNPYGDLYDSTGVQVVDEAANYIVATAIPKGTSWFTFSANREFRKSKEIPKDAKNELISHLEDNAAIVRRLLDRSNWRQAVRLCAAEFLTYGYCAIFVNARPMGNGTKVKLEFESLRNQSFYISPSPSATSCGVYWDRVWTVAGFRNNYPDIQLPENYDHHHEHQELIVTQGIRPLPNNEGFHYVMFLGERKYLLKEEVLENSPIIIARAPKSAGVTYPTGFGAKVLPSLRGLNVMVKEYLRMLCLVTNPPFLVGGGVDASNEIAIEAGARIPVNGITSGPGAEIAQLPIADRAATAFQGIAEVRREIRNEMRLLPPLPEKIHNRTATEVLIGREQERNSMGSHTDDFIESLLLPALGTVFQELKRLNIINPDIVVENNEYSLEIVGDSEKSEKVLQLQEMKAAIEMGALLGPETLTQKFNVDRWYDALATSTRTTRLLNTEEEEVANLEAQQRAQENATLPPQ